MKDNLDTLIVKKIKLEDKIDKFGDMYGAGYEAHEAYGYMDRRLEKLDQKIILLSDIELNRSN